MAQRTRSHTLTPTLSRALIACGAVLVAIVVLIAVGSPQNARANHDAPVAAQAFSDGIAEFLRDNGYPVGRPRVRALRLSARERDAYRAAGTAGSIGGVSLRGGEIEFSDQILAAAASAQTAERPQPSFQLVKLVIHEQLHQVTWSGRSKWFPLESSERERDEGATEALAWDLARIWCARESRTCTGTRIVVPDYAPFVRRIRRLGMDATGSRTATERPVRVWLRTFLAGDDARRSQMRLDALRQRDRGR